MTALNAETANDTLVQTIDKGIYSRLFFNEAATS